MSSFDSLVVLIILTECVSNIYIYNAISYTFVLLYSSAFILEGSRAITGRLADSIPVLVDKLHATN